jgi:hypothetical protein
MTKNFALAASLVMLMTISGQAFAQTAAPNAWYGPEAAGPSDRQAVQAFNAFDRATATETDATNAYRYHGGPKYND